MALGFPGHMAAGIASSPLRMMGGAGSPSASSGNFFQRNGIGSGFNDFASGIRGITRNFAAGFAQDPRVRETAQYGLAQDEAQKQEQKRQIMEWTFKNLEGIEQMIAANPQALKAMMPYINKSMDNLRALGLPDDQIAQNMEYLQGLAQMPAPAGEAQFQQFYNPQTKQSMAVNINDANSVAQAQQQGFTSLGSLEGSDVVSPESEAQKIRIAQASRPPASTTKIDVNQAPPADFRYVYDDQGRVSHMEVIPGSKTAREFEADAAASKAAQDQASKYGDIVVQDIGRAITAIENNVIPVAGVGALASAIPATPQRDLAGLLDAIRANVGFDRLQEMRRASPTGGALGNVTEKENALMQSTLGSLEQSQSGDQLKENLKRVQEVYLDIVDGPNRPRVNPAPEVPEQEKAPEKEASKLTVQDVDAMSIEQLNAVDPYQVKDGAVLKRLWDRLNGQ